MEKGGETTILYNVVAEGIWSCLPARSTHTVSIYVCVRYSSPLNCWREDGLPPEEKQRDEGDSRMV